MAVEPGFLRSAAVFVLSPSRERDEHHGPAPRLLPNSPAHVVAVQGRQPDIEEDHIRTVSAPPPRARLSSVVGRMGLHGRSAPAAWPANRRSLRCRPRPECAASQLLAWVSLARPAGPPSSDIQSRSGRRTTNSLPCPSPALCASTDPPCISTSRFTSVKPMPSPPCDRSSARSTCVNMSKMLCELVATECRSPCRRR